MQRITITLDDQLVEQFEQFRRRHGYENRSEAFRDLVRERLGSERLAAGHRGKCIATLTYVYDHQARDLAARMTRVQHDHHDLTIATLHVHLDHDNCMESVVLRGGVDRVRDFAKAIAAQPGVRHTKLNVLPVTVQKQVHSHGTSKHARSHVHLEPFT